MATYEELDARRQTVITREAGKAGLRGKINAKCAECIYDPGSGGTWRLQVEECTDPACPLYSVRPTSKPGEHHQLSEQDAAQIKKALAESEQRLAAAIEASPICDVALAEWRRLGKPRD